MIVTNQSRWADIQNESICKNSKIQATRAFLPLGTEKTASNYTNPELLPIPATWKLRRQGQNLLPCWKKSYEIILCSSHAAGVFKRGKPAGKTLGVSSLGSTDLITGNCSFFPIPILPSPPGRCSPWRRWFETSCADWDWAPQKKGTSYGSRFATSLLLTTFGHGRCHRIPQLAALRKTFPFQPTKHLRIDGTSGHRTGTSRFKVVFDPAPFVSQAISCMDSAKSQETQRAPGSYLCCLESQVANPSVPNDIHQPSHTCRFKKGQVPMLLEHHPWSMNPKRFTPAACWSTTSILWVAWPTCNMARLLRPLDPPSVGARFGSKTLQGPSSTAGPWVCAKVPYDILWHAQLWWGELNGCWLTLAIWFAYLVRKNRSTILAESTQLFHWRIKRTYVLSCEHLWTISILLLAAGLTDIKNQPADKEMM